MLEVLEEGLGLFQGVVGGVVIAGGVVGVAEVGEGAGFAVAVPGLAQQVECVVVPFRRRAPAAPALPGASEVSLSQLRLPAATETTVEGLTPPLESSVPHGARGLRLSPR